MEKLGVGREGRFGMAAVEHGRELPRDRVVGQQ